MQRYLFLTGFMAVGKTTIGRALATDLCIPFIDLDELIVKTVGKSISDIFSENGESAFRALETSCLNSLDCTVPGVVSTGGGIIGSRENRSFMKKSGTVIYLSAEWELLEQRLAGTDDRPLAHSAGNWSETKQLFFNRIPLYEQADIIVKADQKSVQEIVDEIKNRIQA